ncbi:MAG: HAD family phosphatase [Clostridiales bacterium]|nr:HAD family phosphatase [Clostridiales bacterium]
MYKLAVFDLDGTLLDKHHEISEENLHAIKKLESKGCKIVIATGRPDMLVKEYVKKLDVLEPVISCNGAMIRNPFTKEVVFKKVIGKEDVKDIIELCQKDHRIYMVYTEDAIISTDNYRTQYFIERNQKLEKDSRANFIIEENASYIAETYEVYKILVIEKDADKYLEMYEKFKSFSELTKVQSANGFYDIMPKNTSKKLAIDHLIDHYHIDISEVVAFGDNYNDLEMLKHAGTAITTANGVSAVKEIADFISVDHNESGVSHAINTFLLKENMEA